MSMKTQALEYIRNTGGNASFLVFMEDHEPIGEMLWDDLFLLGLVDVIDGKVALTEKGISAIETETD